MLHEESTGSWFLKHSSLYYDVFGITPFPYTNEESEPELFQENTSRMLYENFTSHRIQ